MSGLGKTVIAGVIIAVIGLLVLLVALGMNGWSFNNDYEIKTYDCTTDVDTLKIDYAAGVLKTEYYDGEKIKIEYPESKSYKATISESESVLNFETEYKFRFFHFNFWQQMPPAVIKIPKNNILSIDLVMNAGTVDIASGQYAEIKANLNAGTLNLENIECDNFYNKLNAGNVKIQDLKTGNSTFEMNAGDIKISNLECSDSFFKVNAGNILIKNLNCNSIKSTLNAGKLTVEKALSQNVDFDINAGTITMKMVGRKEEYNIIVIKDSGSCNLQNQTVTDSSKKINLDIDSGNINIDFIQ